MALLTAAEQKQVSAQSHSPSRSSAVGNVKNGYASVTFTDVVVNIPGKVSVNHRVSKYVLTISPTASGFTPAFTGKYGDEVEVFYVDDANGGTVTGYAKFVWANPNGAQTGTGGWKAVTIGA